MASLMLYIFTFLFIFLWPFGVNILKSVCLLLSNLVLYFWDEFNISKKLRDIQFTLIHYVKNNIYNYCPSCGLLGYAQPPRCHQLPPWPGAVFCYEFFTKNNFFFFASHIDRFVEKDVEVRHILPGGARGDGCWTNSRCERGRRRERGLVNWFDV